MIMFMFILKREIYDRLRSTQKLHQWSWNSCCSSSERENVESNKNIRAYRRFGFCQMIWFNVLRLMLWKFDGRTENKSLDILKKLGKFGERRQQKETGFGSF